MRSPNTLKRTADAAVPVPRRREYVARVLVQYIPEMDQAGAYVVMQKAHKAGMAVVGVWVFEIAEAYTTTQHIITNHEVDFPDGPHGDEARCRAYLQAQHWTAEESRLLGGRYDHRLRKENGAWRIYRISLEIDWMQDSSS